MSLFGGRRRDGAESGPETTPPPRTGADPGPAGTQPAPSNAPARNPIIAPPRDGGGEIMANIGKSIVIKGDLSGNEDLVIEGKVEGKIDLPNNLLTVGAGGNVQAEVRAKTVLVVGRVAGNVTATERLEIQASGVVEGDVRAPQLVVQEGAALNGSVGMSVKEPGSRPSAVPLPAPAVGGGEARRTGS